ncbi:hypothetical protein Tco_1504361 [Tanacetum coccineum]
MGCDENRMSINLAAAVFVAVSILKALKTEDLSRKLEVNYVKFQFRGGLLEVFNQMETDVAKCSVERKTFKTKEKELLLENDRLLELIVSQDLVHTAVNSLAEIILSVAPEFLAFFEINDLKAQLQAKINSLSQLKDHIATLKGKGVSECDKYVNISKVITPGMYKIDLEPLSPKLLKNREAHVDYLKHTQENADTLREIVEKGRELSPLDSDLDSTCKFATRIQELLVYVSATCPSSSKQSEKLIAFTPINKNKKVRFVEHSTSSSNTQKHVDSYNTKDSNKPLLPSTGVINSTSASGSKPLGNTKKNKISRPTSSNKNNKVEDHLRSVKPSLNKKNHVSKPVWNANVKHSVLNVNSELILLHVMNQKEVSLETYRITSTTVVPPKKPLSKTVVKKTPPSSNNLGKLKDITNVVQIILWYLDSGCSKHMTEQCSQLINFISKFMGTVRFGNDHVAEIRGYGDYQIGNVMIYWAYYVEGLGHNLFLVGQFYDSNLEVAFCKHTYYVRDLEGVDLLKGSRGSNLYTMSHEEMMRSSPICLLCGN